MIWQCNQCDFECFETTGAMLHDDNNPGHKTFIAKRSHYSEYAEAQRTIAGILEAKAKLQDIKLPDKEQLIREQWAYIESRKDVSNV